MLTHVLARARDEHTGLDYGAMIEFEADTDQVVDTDETWIFMRGGWGENGACLEVPASIMRWNSGRRSLVADAPGST